MLNPSTPSSLLVKRCRVKRFGSRRGGRLFNLLAVIEERQQRDDERPDVGEMINPIEEIHNASPPSFEEEADTSTACHENYIASS